MPARVGIVRNAWMTCQNCTRYTTPILRFYKYAQCLSALALPKKSQGEAKGKKVVDENRKLAVLMRMALTHADIQASQFCNVPAEKKRRTCRFTLLAWSRHKGCGGLEGRSEVWGIPVQFPTRAEVRGQ